MYKNWCFVFYLQEIGKSHHLSDEDKAKLAAARIAEEQKKSRSWYRVNASRKLFGGKSLEPRLNPQLSVVKLTTWNVIEEMLFIV